MLVDSQAVTDGVPTLRTDRQQTALDTVTGSREPRSSPLRAAPKSRGAAGVRDRSTRREAEL